MTAPGILPEVLDGAAVGIFGILLSAAFCPIRWTGKKCWALAGCTAGLLALQGMFYFGASPTAAKYLYPLITHLPLYVVLVLLSGQKVWPLVAVLTAYLCCQVRRWAALAVALFFPQHPLVQPVAELLFTLPLLRKAAASIFYGDLLVTLRNQTAPYEVKPGAADALVDHWVRVIGDWIKQGRGFSAREMKHTFPRMAAQFAAIPVKRVPKVKVGIVGEIYVKYSPLGNNDLQNFLEKEGCEVNLPGLMGFVQYCLYNNSETVRLYGGSLAAQEGPELLLKWLDSVEAAACKALADHGYHAPARFAHLRTLPNGIIGMGNKMGEGWLLTAEMIELVQAGYGNIVCAQPFGCLPNHICGKGMINKIRALYPSANITPIDYDPSATRVNQENRIKLMLAVAKENLANGIPAPAPATARSLGGEVALAR